jgi:type IV secretory pathway VirB10-like protein
MNNWKTCNSFISSKEKGKIIAQVRENVYDTVSGNYLLLPQGARLVGEYDSVITYGQKRILVVFSRAIMPNGDSISLQNMPGMDLSGYAGMSDEVNEHWLRILGSVVIAAMINSTSDELQNSSGDNIYVQTTSEEVSEASTKIVLKQLNIQPTITVRPGWDFHVFVKKDMILKPYES